MFWLGMFEAMPLFGMPLIGMSLDRDAFPGEWIGLGCGMSLICCWLLRHRTPPTVIHVTERTREVSAHGERE